MLIETMKNTIILGDCLDVMREMPDKCIDLVLTDPPYGIFKREDDGIMFGKKTIYSDDKKASQWDRRPEKIYFDEMRRVSKNQIIFGLQYFIDYLPATKEIFIWDKATGNNGYADGEAAYTSFNGTLRILRHQWCGAFKDSERGLRAIHPTQKPIAVFHHLLNKYSESGMTIFDPFAGSGTTAIACLETGRNYILVEKEPEYVDIINKRIATWKEQLRLFTEVTI